MKKVNFVKRYGEGCWAVITGGSDGIGFGIAEKLRDEGMNIVLIARNEEKLKLRVEELQNNSENKNLNFKAKYVVADFGKLTSHEDYAKIFDELKDLDVGILINNVGIGAQVFDVASPLHVWEQAFINIIPEVMMTKIFIEGFKNRKNTSAVVDISSMGMYSEYTNSGLYGATKAFNRNFNAGMHERFGVEHNIDFLCIKPGFVLTDIGDRNEFSVKKLFKDKSDGFKVFTVHQAADAIIRCMGNVRESYGAHLMMGTFAECLYFMSPAIIFDHVSNIFLNKDNAKNIG